MSMMRVISRLANHGPAAGLIMAAVLGFSASTPAVHAHVQSAPAGVAPATTASATRATDASGATDAHYLVFEDDGLRAARPVYHRFVHMSVPAVSLSPEQVTVRLASRDRLTDRLSFQLETVSGDVVFRGIADVPEWLRGEFASATPGAPIDGHLLALATRTFVVRAPVIPGASLRLLGARGGDSTFDLDQLGRDPALASSTAAAATTPPPSANAANRVDMLIMGDGYTAAQAGNFAADAAALTANFFNLSPYAEYRNYVNVTTLFAPSAQSGSDHPPYNPACVAGDPSCCGDPMMQSDPLAGTFVNTAFDAAYCSRNIHRLLTVNPTKVFAAAAAVPDWEVIMVIVNDATYGGSGGTMSVLSTHPSSVNAAQHEYGHSFTRLADEYDYPTPGYPPCSDINTALLRCEPNVTDQATPALIKWRAWILGSTPLPTPSGNPLYAGVVGLFQGARYLSSGMYRPGDNCLMRSLGQPFCQVASEAYVLRLYQGGWGVSALGIDTIEPGSENHPPGSVQASLPGSVTFTVSLLQPVGAPPLDVAWSVNNVPVPGAHASSFVFTPPTGGNYSVRLDVRDTTPLVNPATPGSAALLHSRNWLVVVEAPPALLHASSGGSSITVRGTLAAAPATVYQVNVYSDATCDQTGATKALVGTLSVTTDNGGNATFTQLFNMLVPAGQVITGTAGQSGQGTSGLSTCATVVSRSCVDDTLCNGYTDVQKIGLGKDPFTYCAIMRADVNDDGAVNALDLSQLSKQFLQMIPPAPARLEQNRPPDNVIDALDLSISNKLFLKNVSACP